MRSRIFRSITLTALCCMLACILMITGILSDSFTKKMTNELAVEASYLARGMASQTADFLENFREDDKRITLVASDGTVEFDNKADASTMENHADRPEIKEALWGGAGSAVRVSGTLFHKTIYYALKLSDGSVLRLSAPTSGVLSMTLSVLQPVLAAAAVTLIVAAFAASHAAKKIVAPINAIDPDRGAYDGVYAELSPLVHRLEKQKRRIDRQIAELQRQKQDETLILSNMTEGLVMLDAQNRIVNANEAAENLFGEPATAGEHVLTLNRSREFCALADELEKGGRGKIDLAIGKKTCRITATPVFREEKRVGGVLLIEDRTERAARETLRREFTDNVSHELMTPVTAVQGYAQLLQNGASDDRTKAFADKIVEGTQQIARIVSDTTTISDLENARLSNAAAEKVDLYDAACRAIAPLLPRAQETGVALRVTGDCGATVFAPPPALEVMIRALANNAVRYNHDGGAATITIRQNGTKTQLVVEDDGDGIAPDAQARVFERFYRGDESHHDPNGAGLGLSIVKHAARLMRAQVEMQSTPGQGTRVTVTFADDPKTE